MLHAKTCQGSCCRREAGNKAGGALPRGAVWWLLLTGQAHLWWPLGGSWRSNLNPVKWTVAPTTGLIIVSSQQENLINTTQKIN